MATRNLVGNPNGIIETEVNDNVAKSGFGQGISPSHFFTQNEGEIKIQYDELLEPNSDIKIKNQWLIWQSPLVSRNLTNQRVRTHYIAQSIKNMWADYRSYMFGGRYGDFTTPELHFNSSKDILFQNGSSTHDDNEISIEIRHRGRLSPSSDYGSWASLHFNSRTLKYIEYAFRNAFTTFFGSGSLGESLGFQTDISFSEINTPNPWPFMAYLNFVKWFVVNKYVMRGDNNFKKVWFPDNEDHFKFETGRYNKDTGIIGRFFSPECRSGFYFTKLRLAIDINQTLVSGQGEVVDSVSCTFYYKGLKPDTDDNVYNTVTITDSKITNWIKTLVVNATSGSLNDFFLSLNLQQWQDFINDIKIQILEKGLYDSEDRKTYFLLDLFETRYMNFNKDYFTGGLISPLIAGDYPSISGSGSISDLTAETTLSGGSVSSVVDSSKFLSEGTPSNRYHPFGINKETVSSELRFGSQELAVNNLDGSVNASDEYDDYLKKMIENILVESTLSNPTAETVVTGTGSFSFGFNIPLLRLLSATSEYLEALARSDGDYRNMVLAIYGVKPSEVSEAPMYIGGSSGFIQTENIFQTAPSEDSPLGNVTQTGYAGGSDYIGSLFVKDTTVVLGLISVVPEIFYYQGVPKKWVMRHKEEHQNPKFNGISMQAVENRELFVSGDDSVDTAPFSYAPAWEFMRHRQNRLSGLLKPHFDPASGILLDKPFTQMTQSRGFSDTPDFNNDFVTTKGNISTEHLYIQDTNLVPEYTVAIKNEITEVLPITKSGVPAKI